MGPRHFSRGITRAVTIPTAETPASMGPRHFSRGICHRYSPSRQDRWLQWGRGISAAELYVQVDPADLPQAASMGPRHFSRGIVCVHPISVRWVLKLQWGRGISAAEFSPLAAGKRCLSCFNGAAAFQPRNCSASGSGLREDRKASMGPRHFSRGITPSPSSNQMDPASFNGAAAFQPRNFEHR